MAILVITVDLQCYRCRKKIMKVLDCLQEEYCIEKVEYEDKNGKVIVRGKFDAHELRKKVCCKACKVVKEIIVVDVWPPPEKPCTPDKPKSQEPQKPCPCEKKPQSEKPTEDKPPPPKPKPVCKLVPYPYPVPYTMQGQSSPWYCPPQQCHCCPKPAPPPSPPPPPEPPKPKPCECSHHGCGCGGKPTPPPQCGCSNHGGCGCGKPPTWPPQPIWPPQHPFCPPPWRECTLAGQEIPSEACSIM